MNLQIIFATSVAVLLGCLPANLAEGQAPIGIMSGVTIGDYLYFYDGSSTMRNRTQALDYCIGQNAELAKIRDTKTYNILFRSISDIGTYWIDGVDKDTPDRFLLSSTICSEEDELSLDDMPEGTLLISARSCLAFVKGSTAATSRIQSQDCSVPSRVMCGYPLDGCTATTTTTVAPP